MIDRPRTAETPPARWRVLIAFTAIYIIWGSAYIAIHFAIQTIPPFVSAAVRFIVAGGLLYLWMRGRGVPNPNRKEWVALIISGFLFFIVDNGCLVWAQQFVPSGITALIVGSTPIFIVLIEWLRPGGHRPSLQIFGGVMLGAIGLILLVDPSSMVINGQNGWLGVLALVVAALSWAIGTIYSQHAHLPKSTLMSTAAQLFIGGVGLSVLALISGETTRINVAQIAPESIIAIIYLALASSIFGFSSYLWLLRVSRPSRVATYSYVNPVIAIALGWALAGEEVTVRTLVAAAIILGSVMLINNARSHAPAAQKDEFDAPAIVPEIT